MASYNKVILMGNLTADPRVGTIGEQQTPVCEFGLAVNRVWKDAQGQAKEEVLFIDCVAYGRTAQNIGQYLAKGRSIHVEGRLKLDRWEQEGQNRSKIRVIVEQFRFVGGGRNAEADEAGKGGGGQRNGNGQGNGQGARRNVRGRRPAAANGPAMGMKERPARGDGVPV